VNGLDGVYLSNPTAKDYKEIFKMSPPFRGHTSTTFWFEAKHAYTGKDMNYTATEPLYLNGSTWITNCWRQSSRSKHIAHFMQGMGLMFSRLLQYTDWPDNIVFHQCVKLNNSFGRAILDIYYDIIKPRRTPRLIFIPYSGNSPTYHIESAEFHPSMFTGFLGPTGLYHRKTRQMFLEHYRGSLPSTFHTLKACQKDKVIIGIYFRSGKHTIKRQFVNMDDVIKTAKQFSSEVFTFTTNESTPIESQAKLYNSFDILVTPHGSHNINALWINHYPTASIEIVYKNWNFGHWDWITDHTSLSEGHTIERTDNGPCLLNTDGNCASHCETSAETYEWRRVCAWKVCAACRQCEQAMKPIQCDIKVNITLLEDELRKAKKFICKNFRP